MAKRGKSKKTKRVLVLVSVLILLFISFRLLFLKRIFHGHLSAPSVIFPLRFKQAGVGNQLFLYACSYAVARSNNIPLYLYCPQSYCQNGKILRNRSFTSTTREFVLDKFNIPMINFVDETVLDPLTEKKGITYFNDQDILEKSYEIKTDTILKHEKGYFCQSQEYWWDYKDEIRAMFQINSDSISLKMLAGIRNKIASSESVAVHVRRGDFITTGGPHPPISMQRQAIRKMENILKSKQGADSNLQPTYFVFSDDYAFAKKQLLDLKDHFNIEFVVDIVSGTTSLEDLLLMKECKHIIFPDSTFSWWAAWLNDNPQKIVITSAFHPDFWRHNRVFNNSQFYFKLYGMMYHLKEWIVINPFTGNIY